MCVCVGVVVYAHGDGAASLQLLLRETSGRTRGASMLKVLVSRAGHDMAAVCLLRPMCSWGYYRPVPVSVCTKLVASSRFLPWVCVNFSSKGLAAGVRIAESATRKAPARPLRLR